MTHRNHFAVTVNLSFLQKTVTE